MQASIQESERYPPLFTVVMPVAGAEEGGGPIQITNLIERQLPIPDVLCIFCGVVLDIQYLIVGTKRSVSRPAWDGPKNVNLAAARGFLFELPRHSAA